MLPKGVFDRIEPDDDTGPEKVEWSTCRKYLPLPNGVKYAVSIKDDIPEDVMNRAFDYLEAMQRFIEQRRRVVPHCSSSSSPDKEPVVCTVTILFIKNMEAFPWEIYFNTINNNVTVFRIHQFF